MSFDWGDYLDLAEDIQSPSVGDSLASAKRRSAVSRAYYAAYHHALSYYKSAHHGKNPPRSDGASGHQALVDALVKSADDEECEAGDKLGDLKGYRHKADYKANEVVEDLVVVMSLTLASEVIQTLA